jgi:hypothetical protein
MFTLNRFSFLLALTVGVNASFFAQKSKCHWYAALEYSLGKTSPANVDFPPIGPQHGFLVSVGTTQSKLNRTWKQQLGFPETGLTFSYVQLGNATYLGSAYTLTPFVNFKVFRAWSSRYQLKVGLGASYFTHLYDPLNNPNNKAISTRFTWGFRTNMYYQLWEKKAFDLKLGLGYFHNSNGHTRLPNNGLNTFLVSLYSQLNFNKKEATSSVTHPITATRQSYYTSRFGLGRRVLSIYDNAAKDVYTMAVSSGVIYNKSFKLGAGMYYRLYKDYYDYIQENGAVVASLYPNFRNNPLQYASTIGISGSGELLFSHVGVELEMGINLYKPAYAFDWQINEEKYKDGAMQLGELTTYYKIKKTISTRLGVKAYLLNTDIAPRHNLFLGAFINANLGQADFTELTLGYQYALPLKTKKKA